MSLAPIDLVSAHPWRRVAFTTYALSLSFFEAVTLDALIRGGGGSQALILADVHGVRASLSEKGAHRVGKDYEVEPIAVSGGVFHPKISVLSSTDECHILVGSGNLTFNGWGGNCEILEHLHPTFASDAIIDAADFFDLLSVSDRVRHGAAKHCAAIAADLRSATRTGPRTGDIRLLHSLDSSITEQIAQFVADLGGAIRLVAAAPFWDGGVGIDALCSAIDIDEVFIHVHAKGSVEGLAGINWPYDARTVVRAVRIGVMDAPGEAGRLLHAKAFEILCRRGRVVVSGSANGTRAALGRHGNVEACVVRIQRGRAVGWTLVPAEPPDPQAQLKDEAETEPTLSGVLRAALEGDKVAGQVLTPNMSGPSSVYLLTPIGTELLAETSLSQDGLFRIAAPDLETLSWRGGRLVIRVRNADGRQAEGFVSVASFVEIARRGGLIAPRLFAVIAGNETPEDVAAVLSWFYENPLRLVADPEVIRSGGDDAKRDDDDRIVVVAALGGTAPKAFATAEPSDAAGHRTWSRFIEQILRALREPRGPFTGAGTGRAGEDEEDDVSIDRGERREKDPSIDKAFSSFQRVFEVLTEDGATGGAAVTIFYLTGYVCDRLRPDAPQARTWLERIIKVLLSVGVPPDHREDIAAAILTVVGTSPERALCRWARGSLLRLGVDLNGPPPSANGVRSYQTVLLQQVDFPELWERVRDIRTYQEQVLAYLEALNAGKPSPDAYRDLQESASEEWSVLEAAITSPEARRKLLLVNASIDACPVDHITLPSGEIDKLRLIGVAMAKNCCRKVIILEGA